MRSCFHIVALLICLGFGGAAAQPATPTAATPPAASLAQQAARRFPQPIPAGALLGRTVLRPLESQPILGTVTGIVRTPDGTVDAVVRYGAVLGFGGRPIAVPLEAMTLLGKPMEIVGFTPAQLDHFPTFNPADATPVPPDTVLHVGLSRPTH